MANKAQLRLAASFTSCPATARHRSRAPVTEASSLLLRLSRHTFLFPQGFTWLASSCRLVSLQSLLREAFLFPERCFSFYMAVPLPDLICRSPPYSLSHCLLTAWAFVSVHCRIYSQGLGQCLVLAGTQEAFVTWMNECLRRFVKMLPTKLLQNVHSFSNHSVSNSDLHFFVTFELIQYFQYLI